jgi:hypothetical protein
MSNLNELLSETKIDSAALGKRELEAGSYAFNIHMKEGATSPFKLFVKERETAMGGRVAEVGMYLKPADDELAATRQGVYVRMPLVGIYEKTKSGKPFDTTVLKTSVATFLAAIGIEGGTIGVADVNTGSAIDLSTADTSKPLEVYLTVNGESITDSLVGRSVNGKLSFSDYNDQPEVKFTR